MQPTAINIANQAVSTAYQWIENNTAALAPITTSSTYPAPIVNQPVATTSQPIASVSAPDVSSSQATSNSDIGGNQSAPQVATPTQATTTVGSLNAAQNPNFAGPVVTAGTSNQEIASFRPDCTDQLCFLEHRFYSYPFKRSKRMVDRCICNDRWQSGWSDDDFCPGKRHIHRE